MSLNFHTHGGNVRNEKTTFPHVVRRQERAKARAAEAAKRTPEEQLARLDKAGLASPKERAKLAQRIADRNKPKPAPKVETAPQAEKKPKLTKEERRAKQRRPYGQRGVQNITAEDAKKLSGTPAPLVVTVPVTIEK